MRRVSILAFGMVWMALGTASWAQDAAKMQDKLKEDAAKAATLPESADIAKSTLEYVPGEKAVWTVPAKAGVQVDEAAKRALKELLTVFMGQKSGLDQEAYDAIKDKMTVTVPATAMIQTEADKPATIPEAADTTPKPLPAAAATGPLTTEQISQAFLAWAHSKGTVPAEIDVEATTFLHEPGQALTGQFKTGVSIPDNLEAVEAQLKNLLINFAGQNQMVSASLASIPKENIKAVLEISPDSLTKGELALCQMPAGLSPYAQSLIGPCGSKHPFIFSARNSLRLALRFLDMGMPADAKILLAHAIKMLHEDGIDEPLPWYLKAIAEIATGDCPTAARSAKHASLLEKQRGDYASTMFGLEPYQGPARLAVSEMRSHFLRVTPQTGIPGQGTPVRERTAAPLVAPAKPADPLFQ